MAASMVVIFHLQMMSVAEIEFGYFKILIDHFGSGVTLFFVLSSFSLAYTNSSTSYSKFLKKRIFRISPLFYFLIIIMTISKLIFAKSIDYSELFANFTFSFNLFSSFQESIVFAGWTIGVEMLFYLTFPFLNNLKNSILILISSLIILLNIGFEYFDSVPKLYGLHLLSGKGIIYHFPTFIIGILTYRFSIQSKLNSNKQKLLLIVIISILYPAFSNGMGYFNYFCQALFYALLTLFSLTIKNNNNIFSNWGLRSYSIYLWHPIIIYAIAVFGLSNISQILFVVLSFILVFITAKISEKYLESIPYKWLKNKFL